MPKKRCGKCKVECQVANFCKERRSKDGLAHWCKGCKREYAKGYIPKRGYSSSAESLTLYSQRTRKKHPLKAEARRQISQAVRTGRLERGKCSYPNCKHSHLVPEAHHWDYSKPMSVTWFCRTHHALADSVKRLLDLNQKIYVS